MCVSVKKFRVRFRIDDNVFGHNVSWNEAELNSYMDMTSKHLAIINKTISIESKEEIVNDKI